MKKIILLLMVLICSVVAVSAQQKFNWHKNCVVAHRGAWKEKGIPQNSIASWREAVRLGVRGSECDVHITADDSLIVFHNLTHHGLVLKDSKYADLMKYPLKNGERIPTFREYLTEVVKQNRTKLIVDVKTMISDEYSLRLSKEIVRVINEMGAMEWCEFLGSNISICRRPQASECSTLASGARRFPICTPIRSLPMASRRSTIRIYSTLLILSGLRHSRRVKFTSMPGPSTRMRIWIGSSSISSMPLLPTTRQSCSRS